VTLRDFNTWTDDVRRVSCEPYSSQWSPLVIAIYQLLLACLTQAPNRKTPWKLSTTRKANVRARLKKVDAVIEAVRASGMQCAALVRSNILLSNLLCDRTS